MSSQETEKTLKQIRKGTRVMVEGEMRRHVAMYSGGSSVASFRSLYYCGQCKIVEA